jgi:ribosomal protein S18 acetylase RimI-like enzyme
VSRTIVEVLDEPLLAACVPVIRDAFQTVADEMGLTQASAPTNPAFMTLERLRKERGHGVRMFALLDGDGPGAAPVGFVALERARQAGVLYLERLAVLPGHRHRGYGRALVDHAFAEARRAGVEKISIGLIDEQAALKRWYLDYGFTVTGTRRFEHLPFTVCFMEKRVG